VASKTAHPVRRLIIFGLLIAALYAGVALGDHDPGKKGYQFGGIWKPKLGLDLQGGTLITLKASTSNGQKVTPANLEEARGIIDQRVNGSGVAESEVGTQGNDNIVVQIPGPTRGDLVNTVKQTAQLRFRLVAAMAPGQPQPTTPASPSASPSGTATPGGKASPSSKPNSKSSSKPSAKQSAGPKRSASPKGRALSSGLIAADKKPKASSSANPSKQPSKQPSTLPLNPSALPSTAAPQTTKQGAPITDQLAWQDNPGSKWLQDFANFRCPKKGSPTKLVHDDKTKPLITCDEDGNKLLLSTPLIEGTQLKSAQATPPNQQNVQWTVNLTFDSDARKIFANVTQKIANQTSPLTSQQKQFAIVLDGKVISAPTVNDPIPNGQAEISGNFTQKSAQSLANSLKYGALPLRFEVPVVTEEGPTLASDQLSAGLIAGAIGLGLVLIYCMLYYRGLGIVVLFSLAIAGVITYAVVLAMSQAVNFTLTLPGIAGLIVAVGITADSFIVYFERIRDEMRTGKSMRVAVEAGWVRARATCLAADSVSLLAAVVLYIFSIGVVKGFAFALGISTVIDLTVFFLFTKPMVSWLATFRFFYSGHRLSGLSPEQVGTRRATPRPAAAGGNA
jgi:preprotein translocase subunit SecD